MLALLFVVDIHNHAVSPRSPTISACALLVWQITTGTASSADNRHIVYKSCFTKLEALIINKFRMSLGTEVAFTNLGITIKGLTMSHYIICCLYCNIRHSLI